MVAKVLAGVGLFFALVAVILKSVALSVPHFVDVHLVADPADANDGNRLGGVGVFQSEFDSNLQGGIRTDIEAENIPIITISTPTTEFPLLFPAQENFFADVLPIDQATLDALDGAIPTSGDTLQGPLTLVTNLALDGDNCAGFALDSSIAVGSFFTALQNDTIPLAVTFISAALPLLTAEGLVEGIRTAEGAAVSVTVAGAGLVFDNNALVDGVQASSQCGDGAIRPSADLAISDAANRGCLAALFATANGASQSDVLEFIIALISSAVACPDASGFTVAQCINANAAKFVVDDTNLFDQATPASFGDNNDPLPCDFITNCTSKSNYLESLSDFVKANVPNGDGDRLGQAIDGYLALAFGVVNENSPLTDPTVGTFANGFPNWPAAGNTRFDKDANKAQNYQPCEVLNPLLALRLAACASLEDFLRELPVVLADAGNELAPTVQSISNLYAAFFASEQTGVLPLSFAPGAFTFGLIEAGFNAEFESQNLAAEVIAACDDDVEDLEKISQAQVLAIASTAFEALAILLIIVGIILPVDKLAYLAPAAAIGGVLGGIFILAALFVVRSAPVYDGVGDEGDGSLEIFFIQGYVPLLALVDAVLFFLSGVVLIVATVFACKEAGETSAVGTVDDIKADGPMEDKI